MGAVAKVLVSLGVVGAIVGVVQYAHAASEPDATPAIRQQVTKALASADPAVMRKLATSLRQQGYTEQAKSLETAATEVERGIKGAGGAAAAVGKVKKALGAGAKVSPAHSPQRSLAGQVALAFTGAKAGSEGQAAQELLKRFQREEVTRKFYVGNIDGLYGPKSALALAFDHGIVPPTPLYWPKANMAAAKVAYAAKLNSKAAKDPQRAEEWHQAASLVA